MVAGRRGVTGRGRTIWLTLALLLGLGRVFAVGPAVAAPAITVISSTGQSNFPQQVSFAVSAQSSTPITSVRLAYRIDDEPVTRVATATFTPGVRVDAHYTIDLQTNYLPVGVTLHYQWQIEDQSGARTTTAWADLPVIDRRFLWHSQTLGPLTLHWYSGDDQFATSVLTAGAAAFATASADIGTTGALHPSDVYIYATAQDFRSAVGVGTDQWVGGQAYPTYHLVVMLAPANDPADAQRTIAEEMTHVAIDGNEGPLGRLPTWLDEGVAVSAEGAPDPALTQALQQAAQAHQLMSLASLSGNFPDDPNGATLAYAESESAVRYFVQTFGRPKLDTLVAGFRQGETSDQAFRQSIGLTTLAFQQRWEASLAQTATGPAAPVRGVGLVTILSAPVGLIVALLQDLLHVVQTTKGQG
jgi:hypothetical protein